MNILERLKELEAKATPGPWKAGFGDGRGVIHGPSIEHPVCRHSDIDFEVIGENENGEYGYVHDIRPPFRRRVDAELCAEMRNALPKLLEFVDAYDRWLDLYTQDCREDLEDDGSLEAAVKTLDEARAALGMNGDLNK